MKSGLLSSLTRGALVCASLAPWLTVVMVYTLALSVRISYGRWPVVYQDSPELPWLIEAILPYAMLPSLLGFIVFPIAWALCFVACVLCNGRARLLVPIITFVSGFAIMFMLGRFDPWGFQEWFWD